MYTLDGPGGESIEASNADSEKAVPGMCSFHLVLGVLLCIGSLGKLFFFSTNAYFPKVLLSNIIGMNSFSGRADSTVRTLHYISDLVVFGRPVRVSWCA